jgi:uncharacterized protein (TIGR02996 family)
MNEESGFLDALIENPRDRTTRLVYADWLDDRGESDRASFLRLWVEILDVPKVGPKRDPDLLRSLFSRLREMESGLDSSWIEQLHEGAAMLRVTVSFRDALPEALEIIRKKFPHYAVKRISDLNAEAVLNAIQLEKSKGWFPGWYGAYENWPHSWKFDLEKSDSAAKGVRRLSVEINPMFEVIFEGMPMVEVVVSVEGDTPIQIDGVESTACAYLVGYDADEMDED